MKILPYQYQIQRSSTCSYYVLYEMLQSNGMTLRNVEQFSLINSTYRLESQFDYILFNTNFVFKSPMNDSSTIVEKNGSSMRSKLLPVAPKPLWSRQTNAIAASSVISSITFFVSQSTILSHSQSYLTLVERELS
ncbi:unnamed protein product [Rotaria sp. Silwood2]|nr:unnamed protein product [Rotaria sp. Silwood2]CAF2734889.1 unnamed protein product [Rotaria sp. Silwood2]CAF3453876.1 unnamed protein product [Rotaria sp. Silwood2]CAF4199038.1 unnamed protein product [Rotaria sp. Silwood2]CAF4432704.1 unnamed protein product [Rotaria sp. Silwood2]